MAFLRSAAKGCGSLLAAALILLASLQGETAAQDAEWPGKEYQIKAVFLFNFVQFVNWPADAFESPGAPLVVGVLGSDPFETYLDEVVRGEKVDGHPIQVVRYERIEDVKSCHLLFVSASEQGRLEPIMAILKSRKILTVGESEIFSRRGGMVAFVNRKGKIRLQINLDAVQAAQLGVSSKLLRLAEIVSPGKG